MVRPERADYAGVRDHIPLEQGLRLILTGCLHTSLDRQRPYSIRTRIKTTQT